MSQRSFCLVAVLLLLLVGGGATTLIVLARKEPAWYSAAAMPSGSERIAQSKDFETEFQAMHNSIAYDKEPYIRFTDKQINSYLEEDFLKMHYDRSLESISQPRVALSDDRIKLGFHYGHGLWSTIVTIDLHVWVPAKEPNVIAMELEGFHAGLLPISAQSVLEEMAEIGRKNNIDINWYRHHGHPVALIRFQPDLPRPTFQILAVRLKDEDHSITIQWRELDNNFTMPAEVAPKTTTTEP